MSGWSPILIVGGILMSLATAVAEPTGPAPAKKEIPIFSLAALSPPFVDFTYFAGNAAYPFQPEAAAFSPVNAWWMAEASTLAYAHPEFAAERFATAGLHDVLFLDRRSTQCYVASNAAYAVVAFRGSEVWRRPGAGDGHDRSADLLTNADVRLVEWPHGGKVHRGFRDALDEVWDDLLPCLTRLQRRGCRIWMTGHSLGAALATLAADRFGAVQGVYTFGSPRVGNRAFSERYTTPTFRIVNGNDIVTRLPPDGFYAHVGEPRYIDRDGNVRAGPVTPAAVPLSRGCEGRLFTQRGTDPRSPFLVPDAVIDHVPTLYAILMWNHVVALSAQHP